MRVVPVETAALAGPLLLSPAALDLWGRRAAEPRFRLTDGIVQLRATVPDGGQLRVRLGQRLRAADAPVRERDEGIVGAPMNHSGESGVSILVDRSARQSVVGYEMTCSPTSAPAPPADFTLRLKVSPGRGVDVEIDGEPVMACAGRWAAEGAFSITSGVRRVQIHHARFESEGRIFEEDFTQNSRSGWAAAAAGAALGLLLPSLAPLLVFAVPTLLLGQQPLRGNLDALRLVDVPESFGPLLFGGIPALILGLAIAARRLPTAASALIGLGFGIGIAAYGRAIGGSLAAWALLGGIPPLLTLLFRVNLRPTPYRPALSLMLTVALLGVAEYGIRRIGDHTLWTRTSGWVRATSEFQALLELKEYRTYPDNSFPVRPPAPSKLHQRLVALGGSSTGGAFQMDDLRWFWPKALEEQLQATDHPWQVVNQGVGGWNSLHIRLYVESQIENLDPDTLVIYLGHNDLLSTAPVTYRELYSRYLTGAQPDLFAGPRELLNRYRLYVGFKHMILSLRDGEGMVAVPLSDAEVNLRAILDVATARDNRVLLVTEALHPDPVPMAPYTELLQRLAADERWQGKVASLDAATRFFESGDPDDFLDDCHLTVPGHRRLAGWIGDELARLGWL